MSFEFRQESTKTRRFSKEKWPKMSQIWLKRSLISRTWLEPKCAHPKNSPKWPFSRQKKRNKHFTVWTYRNIFFVSFLSGSPFFVQKIFTRPSVVLCLSLKLALACPSGWIIWIICTPITEHLGIVSGEQTRSLRSLSRISQAKMDGHSALYLESIPSQVSFYPPVYILLMSKLPNLISTNLSTRCTTEFVATLGFDPPIAFGRIDPVS